MESDLISSPIRVPDPDFGFAFNDSNFSDRLLRIEIVTSADWAATRKRKRSRRDIVKKDTGSKSCATSAGDEATNRDDCSKVSRVEMLHISSPILAAKSPFFYKLFSNGMMESAQRHVTLRISLSEEAAVMELLNFMYSNTLTVTTAPAILHVFMAADKFDVPSCMRHCSRLLRNLRMTTESALLYLDLPSSVLIADVQPLTDAAKQFLASRYKDISKYEDAVMDFPLAGIEAILSSNELLVDSEDAVYDFVLKWTRTNYQTQEKRRHILCCLGRYIRFPYMTGTKLRKVLTCTDFDHDFATKNVLDALFFKDEAPYHRRTHATEDSTYTSCCFKERAYKFLPVKVTVFGVRRLQCAVYLDLKREECSHLFPSGWVHSQVFFVGGRGFFLCANCNRDKQNSSHCFGLSLGMQVKNLQVKDSTSFDVDYEFAARSKLTKEYISKYKGNYTFKAGGVSGCRNLFDIPWTSFIGDDGLFIFINGTLHLRAQLTIKSVSRT